jgi:transposase
VRSVLDNEGQQGSRWQAVMSIDAKIGCAPQTVNGRVRKPEIDSDKRPGISGEMADLTPAADRPCHLL